MRRECWLPAEMVDQGAMDFRLRRFGDARLEKAGPICTVSEQLFRTVKTKGFDVEALRQ